ncbi:peptidoglycan DD-metalloendopeptidase family protein [Paenibacillus gansuensis]|uniref:Peptidoglycan DD-metalloendopeptidase family protein n=1 Tax=Paenibacillus gansuensis TaxID=306542 RepID=A0ABW5PDP7_9BACL
MEMKDNIRQRRKDRIRSITSQGSQPDAKPPALPQPYEEGRLTQHSLLFPTASSVVDEEKYRDPEWLWKQQIQTKWSEEAGRTYNSEDQRWKEWRQPPTLKQLQWKLLFCVLIFGGAWAMFQSDHPLAVKGQQIMDQALHQPFDYSGVQAWYHDHFAGTPVFLPLFNGMDEAPAVKASAPQGEHFIVPARGTVVQAFAATLKGIEIDAGAAQPVAAAQTGRVIYVGETPEEGWSVIIRHTDGYQTYYRRLSTVSVETNDWVEGGEAIGKSKRADRSGTEGEGSTLYFALKHNKTFVDPTEVMDFD